MGRSRRSLSYIALLAVLAGPLSATAAQAPASSAAAAAEEDQDQKAKRLFVAGQYAEAIDILSRLYTTTNNPVYLRNIGRCHQRLRDPDRAIASFEEYLLRAKNISKAERDEVKGFVRDLEEMKRRKAGEAGSGASDPRPAPLVLPPTPSRSGSAPATLSPPSPAAGHTTIPPATGPGFPSGASSPPHDVAATPAPASPNDLAPGPIAAAPMPTEPLGLTPQLSPSLGADVGASTGRPLARTLAIATMALAGALAVGGGVVLGTSWSKYRSAEKSCRGNFWCADTAAKSVEGRNRTAKILLAGALVTGAAGVTIYLLNPGGGPKASGLALGLGGRF